MNNLSPGNRFGEGTSGATPHLDQDQPGPSHENVQDEFFESDSDEEEVFNLNGNDDDGNDGDDGDDNDNMIQCVVGRTGLSMTWRHVKMLQITIGIFIFYL